MRTRRAAQKLEKLKGDGAAKPETQSLAPSVVHAIVPTMQIESEGMTREQWAKQLVALGVSWVNRSNQLLMEKPRDAVHVAKAGVDLVNANILFLPSDREGEPQKGSLAVVDKRFLSDPEFRHHAHELLRRKREILEAEEAAG